MKDHVIVAVIALLTLTGFASLSHADESQGNVESALPFVIALPTFHDMGAVRGSSFSTVTFMNNSRDDISFFNAYCSGDVSAFQCSSFCNQLPAGGTCSVQVTFHARSNDGMRKSVTVYGSGAGAFATSTVYATDAK